MMTVKVISNLTGVSIRTLRYYDEIGLLAPAGYTDSGYRLYDDTTLERLQQILLFKELNFSLDEIKNIISSPNFDVTKALEQQITMLTLKKERLENIIKFARALLQKGGKTMSLSVFDTKQLDEYMNRAKEQWSSSSEYKEFEQKNKNQTPKDRQTVVKDFMQLFSEFGQLKEKDPAAKETQDQVKKLQDYITDHFYSCSDEILSGLGQMYAIDNEFATNIDSFGGVGTAKYVSEAIKIYCKK